MRGGVRREPRGFYNTNSLRFARHHATWTPLYRTGGTHSSKMYDGKSEDTPISEQHLGKFPDSVDFSVLEGSISRPTFAPIHYILQSQCLGIKEVEVANSVDFLMTSQSIEGRDFTGFEMLDAMIASVLKKVISNPQFQRRVSVEEQRTLQNTTDFCEEGRLPT